MFAEPRRWRRLSGSRYRRLSQLARPPRPLRLPGAVQGEHGYDLFFAALPRIKGDILVRREAVTAAENSFRKAIEVARLQEALFWELRAALGLRRLRKTQGRGEATCSPDPRAVHRGVRDT